MTIDVEALRNDTPGCRKGLIHLNNAGAGLMPRPVIDAVTGHLALEADHGGYEAAADAIYRIESFYRAAATLVGASTSEIAFLDSATRAWQAAFHAIDWKPRDEILTASSEYCSNMISFRHAEQRFGIKTVIAPDTGAGVVDPDGLEALISSRTRLICITHMPTNDGLLNPVAEIGQIASRHGIPFLLDACQSVGQHPIDVQEIKCTMLSATGRKYLRGPRGTGFLWICRDWLEKLTPCALDIKSARWTGIDVFESARDALRFELWERNVASQIGLGVACDYATAVGVPAIWVRVQMLAEYLREAIADIPGMMIFDRGLGKSGIITFGHVSLSAKQIVAWLRQARKINTSVSATQLTRVDMIERGLVEVVRASVHAYNTVEELDQVIKVLRGLAAKSPGRALPATSK